MENSKSMVRKLFHVKDILYKSGPPSQDMLFEGPQEAKICTPFGVRVLKKSQKVFKLSFTVICPPTSNTVTLDFIMYAVKSMLI